MKEKSQDKPRPMNKRKRVIRFLKIFLLINFILTLFILIADKIWFQGSGYPPPHLKIPGLFDPKPIISNTYALVVNGAVRPKKNHPRYWNNISLMYATLRFMGFESIYVLNSDGLSPEPDQLIRAFLAFFPYGDVENSPLDLDLDGSEDITGPATPDFFETTLKKIGQQLHQEGRLFIFFTDHGKLRFKHGRFYTVVRLWGKKNELSGRDLNLMLEQYLPSETWVTVLAAQCWGANFLKQVKRDRTILMAPGRPNWIWSDHDYSIFPYLFCEALLQRSPKNGEEKQADPNGDGFVNLREAFEIARKRDHAPEWPIMWIIGDVSSIPFPF